MHWPETARSRENDQPDALLELLKFEILSGKIDRKWRLYLCACARYCVPAEQINSRALEAAEQLADSADPARPISWSAFSCAPPRSKRHRGCNRIKASLLNDIFGKPFQSVEFDPRWRTSTVLDLARTIYDEFPHLAPGLPGDLYADLPEALTSSQKGVRMQILADALMDAGCDSEDILSHCHHKGPHVRGCWVVDLILGKS